MNSSSVGQRPKELKLTQLFQGKQVFQMFQLKRCFVLLFSLRVAAEIQLPLVLVCLHTCR